MVNGTRPMPGGQGSLDCWIHPTFPSLQSCRPGQVKVKVRLEEVVRACYWGHRDLCLPQHPISRPSYVWKYTKIMLRLCTSPGGIVPMLHSDFLSDGLFPAYPPCQSKSSMQLFEASMEFGVVVLCDYSSFQRDVFRCVPHGGKMPGCIIKYPRRSALG